MRTQRKQVRGVSLIEGLVAIVVLSVGLLALFGFQAEVLRASAIAKARTEALQLAQSRLGELRNTASDYQAYLADPNTQNDTWGERVAKFPGYLQGLASAMDTRDNGRTDIGTNADFSFATNVAAGYPPVVMVVVSWAGPGGVAESTTAAAQIGLKDAVGGALLAATDPSGGFIKAPTGEAEYGNGEKNTNWSTYDRHGGNPNAGPGSIISDDGYDNGDGTVSVIAEDGTFQLLDVTSNEILIKSKSPLGRIQGTVYIVDGMNLDGIIKVGAPDVSWCTTADMPGEPIVNSGGSAIYDALPYTCYVGADWYGAIGPLVYKPNPAYVFDPDKTSQVIRSEFGPNDKVCVGQDGVNNTGFANSRHPQQSFIRTYRGYTQLIDKETNEPVRDAQGNILYASSGIKHEKNGSLWGDLFLKTDHDFVIDTISSEADSACYDRLYAGEGAAPVKVTFEKEGLAADSPDRGNPGKFYCLTDICPKDLPVDTGERVVSIARRISGRFRDSNGNGVPNGVVQTGTGEVCEVDSEVVGGYVCTVYDLGSGWTGNITATAPTGYSIASVDIDGDGDLDGVQRSFANLENDATGVDFVVQASTVTERIVGGMVNLYGVDRFGGLSANPVPSLGCTYEKSGVDGVSGPFSCRYSDLPPNTVVTITVTTAKSNHVLCGTVTKSTSVVVLNANVTNMVLNIADLSELAAEERA
jgi:Tfp pilus assembly protein PilV